MRLFPKIKLSTKLVDLAFRFFETPVEEMVYSKSRVVEYSYVLDKLLHKGPCKVLDVGCTYRFNYVTPTLASLGWEVCGVDIREYRFTHPRFHFIGGDIRRTDIEDNYFDHIYCVSTIEHIGIKNSAYEISEEDLNGDQKAMKEMRRILKSSGSLFLTTEFGKAETSKSLRVYDSSSIRQLFSDWKIKEMSFYTQDTDGYWRPVSEKEASLKAGEPHALVVCELSPGK